MAAPQPTWERSYSVRRDDFTKPVQNLGEESWRSVPEPSIRLSRGGEERTLAATKTHRGQGVHIRRH